MQVTSRLTVGWASGEPAPPEGQDAEPPPAVTDAMILRMLKSEKVQAAYADWMKANRSKVNIDINSRQWERISGKSA